VIDLSLVDGVLITNSEDIASIGTLSSCIGTEV
jgi:hypothetical protein